MGLDELDRLELDLVTFLSAPDTFLPMFLKDIAADKTSQILGRIMSELVKTKLAVQELVVLVGHGCLSQKSFLWVITLHKIVLVGDDAPQNRSCGVVVPPQTRSCEGKKVNTKCK